MRGPYKFITINSQTYTIYIPYKPTQFHLTVIKPYYKDDSSKPLYNAPENALKNALENALKDAPGDTLKDALKENYKQHTLEENHNQYTLEGDYNLNTIVVDMP